MAVEIKELIIRAVVDYPDTPASKEGGKSSKYDPQAEHNQQAIIQACVKQVMKILKQQKKR